MSFLSCIKDVFAGRRPIGDVVKDAINGYRTIRVAEFPLGGRIVTWDKHAITGDTLHGLPL